MYMLIDFLFVKLRFTENEMNASSIEKFISN